MLCHGGSISLEKISISAFYSCIFLFFCLSVIVYCCEDAKEVRQMHWMALQNYRRPINSLHTVPKLYRISFEIQLTRSKSKLTQKTFSSLSWVFIEWHYKTIEGPSTHCTMFQNSRATFEIQKRSKSKLNQKNFYVARWAICSPWIWIMEIQI